MDAHAVAAPCLGVNTLYPGGRLRNAREEFGLPAHRQALTMLRDAGFSACEFSHYEHFDVGECETLRQYCRELGVRPWSAHAWGALPARLADVPDRLPGLRASLEGATALGVQVMVVHSQGGIDLAEPGERRDRAEAIAATLRQLCGSGDASQPAIAVENCAGRDDLEFLVKVIVGLELAKVGLNIDTGHAWLHGIAPATAIALMGEKLLTTHLQDNHGERDEHLPPGQGTIDWRSTFAALRAVDYAGALMVELSDCPPGREPDPATDLQQAISFLRDCL